MAKIIPPSEFIINPDGSCFHLHITPEHGQELRLVYCFEEN